MALDLVTLGMSLLDKVILDPTAKQAAQLELLKLHQSGDLAQLTSDTTLAQGQDDINKVEASSTSLFVAGWRPFIGWVCGTGLGYDFVVQPLLQGALAPILHTNFPVLDVATLITLLLGMMGLGSMRTVEKLNKVA